MMLSRLDRDSSQFLAALQRQQDIKPAGNLEGTVRGLMQSCLELLNIRGDVRHHFAYAEGTKLLHIADIGNGNTCTCTTICGPTALGVTFFDIQWTSGLEGFCIGPLSARKSVLKSKSEVFQAPNVF